MEKSKKIFVLILPDHGHINPVACALAQFKLDYPDHEIIFYGSEPFRAVIERAGCTYREYSNFIPEDARHKQPPLTEQGGYFFSFNPLVGLLTRQLELCDSILPGLVNDVERDRPDLIIYDVFSMHAKYLLRSLKLRYKRKISNLKPPKAIMFATTVAQKLGVFPTFSELRKIIKLDIGFFISVFLLIIRQLYFSWKHGLDVVDIIYFLTNHDEETVIVTVFPEFQPKREHFGAEFKFVGSCISETVRTFDVKDERLKRYLDTFKPFNPLKSVTGKPKSDSKLIYASLGTVANNNPFLFEHMINAIKLFDQQSGNRISGGIKIDLIISTGNDIYDILQAKIREKGFVLPGNVLLQRSVPQIEVLKRVSLFITHGGMNSTSESILYGVPVICIPIMGDQHAVARRLEELKLAKVIRPLELTPDNLHSAIVDILSDDSYLERMITFAKTSKKYNGNKNSSEIIANVLSNTDGKKDK